MIFLLHSISTMDVIPKQATLNYILCLYFFFLNETIIINKIYGIPRMKTEGTHLHIYEDILFHFQRINVSKY